MIHIYLLALIFVISCTSQQKQKLQQNNSNDSIQSTELSDPEYQQIKTEYEIKSILSNVIDFKLGDNIVLNSPKKFIQISLLFTVIQNSNYSIISQEKVSEDQINDFMNEQRQSFYKQLGITEDQFIAYSINNAELIQEYLSTDVDMAYIYELVQTQVTD